MKTYHVTYYYHATGMEGVADTKDHGIFYAESKDGAIRQCIKQNYPNEVGADREFLAGCLTAKEAK